MKERSCSIHYSPCHARDIEDKEGSTELARKWSKKVGKPMEGIKADDRVIIRLKQ